MYKACVIGDYDSIKGFSAVGLTTFYVANKKEAIEKLKEIEQDNYSIIYITEELAILMEQELLKYKKQFLPCVVSIPGVKGRTGYGMESIRKLAIKAIGSDIITNSN